VLLYEQMPYLIEDLVHNETAAMTIAAVFNNNATLTNTITAGQIRDTLLIMQQGYKHSTALMSLLRTMFKGESGPYQVCLLH
ncbi:hypothetical protein SARC_17767, partial [Sphaeroforma arctica JP610]